MLGMWVGTVYGTTAAKGVFSVSGTKKVQFANANSVYSENDLIQWAHLDDLTNTSWDVLTGDEWTYLLVTRDGEGPSKNNLGTVAGDSGLIILPDVWVQPEGTSYAATPIDYKTNVYNTDEWALMADAGAVFLPCAGYGYNDSKDGDKYKEEDTDDHGAYWAKDEVSEGSANAYCMRFNVSNIHDLNYAVKTNYYSVILVRDVTVYLDENDDKDNFYAHWTAAKGKGYAYVRRSLKKDSTLYTLCLPFDVPDIDDSPLAGAEVFAFTGGDVSGTPGDERLHLHMKRLEGKRLTQGVPYLLRWMSPGGALSQPLYFEHVENWDADTTTATHPGNDKIKCRGVYPKTHIPDYTSGSVPHYNFFLGANNTLYWPDKTNYASSDMKGFRGYFYVTPGGYPAGSPVRRGMQAVWEIDEEGSATGIGQWTMDNGQWTKIFRDGQIILVIDGKEYTIWGLKIGD